MTLRILSALVVAAVLIAGSYLLWHREAKAPTSPSSYNWTFADAGTDSAGNTQTRVSLNGRAVGTFKGTCQEIDGSGWDLLPGEQSGVICWSADDGTEVGVFGKSVKQGTLTEGSTDVPATRGNFTTLFAL